MITIIVIMVTIKKREGKEQELRKKILPSLRGEGHRTAEKFSD
jgi:hypothetical protein